MKIKLDENMPRRLVAALEALGHDVDTVIQEALTGRDDEEVWRATQTAERFFITQDLDFSDLRRFVPGTHGGLLLLRMHEPGRLAVARRIETLFQTQETESWKKCFVLATDRKLRIRHPSSI
jgi:predicted nuclease of predicted toxin-antitoxin system